MSMALNKYLDRVMIYANRRDEDAPAIRDELEDHLLKKVDELIETDIAREDAIFQAIEDHGHPAVVGYGLRRRFPLIDIRTRGMARGVIAIGPSAVGVVAMGGAAVGVIAFGGVAVGLFSYGALAIALVLSCGAMSASTGVAIGAFALGGIALGNVAVGVVAKGNVAIGLWSPSINASYYYSYFTDETAPALLKQATFVSRWLGAHWMVGVVYWLIMPAGMALEVWAFVWETIRMKKNDPKMVD